MRYNRSGMWTPLLLAAALPLSAATVGLLAPNNLSPPAAHGIAALTASLQAKGHTVQRDNTPADFYLLATCQPGMSTSGPQSLIIRRLRHRGQPAVAFCGGDARGLQYAAHDIARRISHATAADPFEQIRDTAEQPFLPERGISIYTMQRAYFESRLHDENYWRQYFDLLAASRINTFTIIFGYENGGFMAPLYPYFFDTPEFPSVRLTGITKEQQQRNTAAFRALLRIAHERGIDVIPAIWDHIYRGGVQGGGIAGANDTVGKSIPGLVTGVTSDNLTAYTKAALRQFLQTFPDIDGLEFRMHAESGLKPEEMAAFWHDVFTFVARAKPGLRITLRAKELPDSIIDDALTLGLRARVETKYWMEQMGLPFHPTHVNRQNQHDRRHGYADLLKYPQRYRVHWRLWSGGTTRLLLWGDPDYVRRFAHSARLYDGQSIDINEMLATRMLGEPHDRAPLPIHTSPYRFYQYEFQRYWHFYQLWGRLTYNPETPSDTWEREFQQRFGPAGASLQQGLHTASRVLPRIVAASYRYQLFPTTRGWAEMMRQGDLPQFADAEGSDIEQFQSPREAARAAITSKRHPYETSAWFQQTATDILRHVTAAEAAGATSPEARTTITDLRILAGLARFHAARLQGAVAYNAGAMTHAIEHERSAVTAWREIVAAAGDVYHSELPFGVHRVGFPRHWKEELAHLEAGLAKLTPNREAPLPAVPQGAPPAVELDAPPSARPGQDLLITARAANPGRLRSLRLRYRHLTQYEDYQTLDMTLSPNGLYSARIPGAFLTPQWDLVYFVEAIDHQGRGRNYPDLESAAPYIVVPLQRQKGKP